MGSELDFGHLPNLADGSAACCPLGRTAEGGYEQHLGQKGRIGFLGLSYCYLTDSIRVLDHLRHNSRRLQAGFDRRVSCISRADMRVSKGTRKRRLPPGIAEHASSSRRPKWPKSS